ncbi:MAG: peroxide stress protein YaaA [Gammaproteobacteria bacterium AqS3]|nr:peroxide stress protein YaaA [Gammaproteobacteria bacterium AqS3]
MRVLISPAKKLDFESAGGAAAGALSEPEFIDRAGQLVRVMRRHSIGDLRRLMNISEPLARLNRQRFAEWGDAGEAPRAAIHAFQGDVYVGLEAEQMSRADLRYAQKHLRILSGLYGLLRPLDAIQPYRLEMGSRLKTRRGATLYDFWGSDLTDALNAEVERTRNPIWVNLASQEYAGVLQLRQLRGRVIEPQFRDLKNGAYKVISFFAKKARGALARFIIVNRIKRVEDLLDFDGLGYRHSPEHSSEAKPVFLRD